jgi:hypothetical protein
MDVPIGLVEWEVFLSQRYKVADFGGDALSARLLPAAVESAPQAQLVDHNDIETIAKLQSPNPVVVDPLRPGQVGGFIADPAGGAIARADVTVLHLGTGVTLQAFTDTSGRWMVANVPSGRLRIMASASGFRATAREIDHDAGRGSWFSLALQVGSVSETVEVTASAPRLETSNAATAIVITGNSRESQQVERASRQNAAPKDTVVSLNVADLQRRVVGVLPIGMSVPHTGTAYHFARPLVVDEETRLTFSYRSK